MKRKLSIVVLLAVTLCAVLSGCTPKEDKGAPAAPADTNAPAK